MATIEIPYSWADADGAVRVEVATNERPTAFGCEEFAHGFPYCKGTVVPHQIGYEHLCGWVQLLSRSDHDEVEFEIDHFPTFADPERPFCYFGYSPTFFDAPHTDELEDWDFLAHTFYCGRGGRLGEFRREARAILGFSWGFTKRGWQIDWFGPDLLSPQDWDRHHEYLDQTYCAEVEDKERKWSFRPGFSQHPLEP